MKKIFLLLLIIVNGLWSNHEKPRLLILIIASQQFPVYTMLQNIWRFYMHKHPQIDAYFLQGDPDLETLTHIKDDTIYIKTKEGWILPSNTPAGYIPASPAIINKTILGLEALLPNLHQYDFILRTNLSSFYVFDRLLDYLSTLPKNGCYAGSLLNECIASGCGFIMSPDVVELIIQHKNYFIDNMTSDDDVLIGNFLCQHNIKAIGHERYDIVNRATWREIKKALPQSIFHFRVKLPDSERLVYETAIRLTLAKKFYYIDQIV